MGISTFDLMPPECPACDGATVFLGRLGSRDHWTCRACGLQMSTPAEPDPLPADDWDGADEW